MHNEHSLQILKIKAIPKIDLGATQVSTLACQSQLRSRCFHTHFDAYTGDSFWFKPIKNGDQICSYKGILWKQRLHQRTETRVCIFPGPD